MAHKMSDKMVRKCYNAVREDKFGSAGDGIACMEDDGVGVVTNGASEALAGPCFHGQVHRIS